MDFKGTKLLAILGIALSIGVASSTAVAETDNKEALNSPIYNSQNIYKLKPIVRNYKQQISIIDNPELKREYVMGDNLGSIKPIWAEKMLFDWARDLDGCFYGAWINNNEAKVALQNVADAVVQIQLSNDFMVGKYYKFKKTVRNMSQYTDMRRDAIAKKESAYKMFQKGISVCYSDKMMGIKRKMKSCNPDKEVCPCWIDGKAGLEVISTSPSVDNQLVCKPRELYDESGRLIDQNGTRVNNGR